MKGKIFITGGAGTLGRAIIERWKDVDITIYSTDPTKHHKILADFPNVISVIGDILDYNALATAMAGHDIVIHAAAMKFIPEGEKYPHYTFEVNVNGSYNVIHAALQTGIKQVVAISTDKAVKPINAYGFSKAMMERLFQEASQGDLVDTKFHLVRYGNVLGSSGSFIHNWKRDLKEHGKVFSTNPEMTRFWLTVGEAVWLIERALQEISSGEFIIPNAQALSIGEIESYLLEGVEVVHMGARPGEKLHEELLTTEELKFAHRDPVREFIYFHPGVFEGKGYDKHMTVPLSSETAPRIPKEEFIEMIGGWK